jgi:hypothetical protein
MESSTAVASAAVLLALLGSLLQQTPAALASVSGKPRSSYVVYLGGHPPRADGVLPEVASRRATDSHYDLLGAVLGE